MEKGVKSSELRDEERSNVAEDTKECDQTSLEANEAQQPEQPKDEKPNTDNIPPEAGTSAGKGEGKKMKKQHPDVYQADASSSGDSPGVDVTPPDSVDVRMTDQSSNADEDKEVSLMSEDTSHSIDNLEGYQADISSSKDSSSIATASPMQAKCEDLENASDEASANRRIPITSHSSETGMLRMGGWDSHSNTEDEPSESLCELVEMRDRSIDEMEVLNPRAPRTLCGSSKILEHSSAVQGATTEGTSRLMNTEAPSTVFRPISDTPPLSSSAESFGQSEESPIPQNTEVDLHLHIQKLSVVVQDDTATCSDTESQTENHHISNPEAEGISPQKRKARSSTDDSCSGGAKKKSPLKKLRLADASQKLDSSDSTSDEDLRVLKKPSSKPGSPVRRKISAVASVLEKISPKKKYSRDETDQSKATRPKASGHKRLSLSPVRKFSEDQKTSEDLPTDALSSLVIPKIKITSKTSSSEEISETSTQMLTSGTKLSSEMKDLTESEEKHSPPKKRTWRDHPKHDDSDSADEAKKKRTY